MWSIRNLGGVSLFLFGSTFLWLAPFYVGSGVDTSGAAWAAVGVLAVVTIVSFSVATWGLFRDSRSWERFASAGAVLGLVTLVPYSVAADGSAIASPTFDIVIHAVGCAAVLVLLHVPRLEHWVHGHVAAGR